jgi:predicted RNA-binding protein with PIN domain
MERTLVKEKLIVDGYNVIYAWPDLANLKDTNLEHARDKLVDMLASYGAYKNYNVIIVFDAHSTPGVDSSYTTAAGVTVVFTSEGETADSYIEKLSYDMIRRGERIYVVTSDWIEQLVVLWAGAYRMSARELLLAVNEAAAAMRTGYSQSVINYRRSELAGRLDHDTVKRLNDMRRGR